MAVVALAVAGAAVYFTVNADTTRANPPTIVVYGDSLTAQAETAITARLPFDRVVFRAKGGTALCDWVNGAPADRAAERPSRVVIAFTGNTIQTCASVSWVSGYLAGGVVGAHAATVANYETALRQMRAVYADIPVTVVGSPAMAPTVYGYPANGDAALNAMYERVCTALHMRYNAAADASLTPGHVYRRSGPLTPGGADVQLRLDDGVHLTEAGIQLYAAALTS